MARGAVGILTLAGITGCEDQLPTISGEDRFPAGASPTTVEVILSPEEFLRADTVFGDFTDPRDARFLLVAREFDGVLDAHSLARFTGFPDSVTVTVNDSTRTDTAFVYGAGSVRGVVNAAASTGPVTLRLWALEQAWDTAAVSWEIAEERDGTPVRWRVPGGTRGQLLSEATWVPGDTAAADTVTWQIDSLAVARMSEEGFPGILITSETGDTRVQLSRLSLRTALRPASKPDTALDRTITAGPQAFIFDPPPPQPDTVYRVGGLTGERTVLRLDLSGSVPGCANPETDAACPRVALRDVTLNRAELVLSPTRVTAGYRPLRQTPLRIRRVVEPELGRLAPLGETLALDSVAPARFASPAGEPVSINLTSAIVRFAATDSATSAVALLSDLEGRQVGYLWFENRPRLRLVYTLPLSPRLP